MKRLFIIAIILLLPFQIQAEWELAYDEGEDMYAVLSDRIAVRTVSDKTVKTHMIAVFMCYRGVAGKEGLSLLFTDVPRFSNKDKRVDDLGESRSFGIMTGLHTKGKDEPKLSYPKVKQPKEEPQIVVFDMDFVQKMRLYDMLSIGFGWQGPNKVESVTAHIPLDGLDALIYKARRKCDSP